jgi:anti-sigma factor RsiW
MKLCSESIRVQDYLDGELVPGEREAFEAHLAACADCAAEVALYRIVFHRLDSLPLFEPSPQLADRVLAEIMPAHPGRWMRWAGWAYASTIAGSLAAIGAAIALPGPRAWTQSLAADATRSLVGSLMFVLKSFNATTLRLLDVLGGSGEVGARFGALFRALTAPLSHPVVVFTLWAAVLTCGIVLWWMRPREGRAIRESDHVALLGL